eukprot:6192184-Pleurochrysis_carterae.AAC.1
MANQLGAASELYETAFRDDIRHCLLRLCSLIHEPSVCKGHYPHLSAADGIGRGYKPVQKVAVTEAARRRWHALSPIRYMSDRLPGRWLPRDSSRPSEQALPMRADRPEPAHAAWQSFSKPIMSKEVARHTL